MSQVRVVTVKSSTLIARTTAQTCRATLMLRTSTSMERLFNTLVITMVTKGNVRSGSSTALWVSITSKSSIFFSANILSPYLKSRLVLLVFYFFITVKLVSILIHTPPGTQH